MNEQLPSSSLAERALARVRKIAEGNGLEPSAITVFETQEQVYALKGIMAVSPLCETEVKSLVGSVRSKGIKTLESFAELQRAVDEHQKAYCESRDWVAAATKELRDHEGQGWGLESAKVSLNEKSAVFAASELCPSCAGSKMLTCEQCLGVGTVICTQCQGQGRELCFYCMGRGEDPQQPGQRCHTCNGTRFAPCRYCQSHGHLPCPTCNGKRGTPCATCQATGRITQEITVTCGAETHFKLEHDNLPSGLRRGLDRIGVAALGKGHADITTETPAPPKEGEEIDTEKPIPVLTYSVFIPYAEMKVDIGGKKAIISAVGKRCAVSGVPNFLDLPLKPWRDKLKMAAGGLAPLAEALEARAMRDVLRLIVSGKGSEKEVRRVYPFGMSSEVIGAILADMRVALRKTTQNTRTIIALACFALCAALFWLFFTTGVEAHLTQGQQATIGIVVDAVFLALCLMGSWVILNFSTRWTLQKRFPGMPYALKQKIGKIGLSMLSGITVAFILFMLMAPVKPLWLVQLAG